MGEPFRDDEVTPAEVVPMEAREEIEQAVKVLLEAYAREAGAPASLDLERLTTRIAFELYRLGERSRKRPSSGVMDAVVPGQKPDPEDR